METISTSEELKKAIQILEYEKDRKGELLKAQFHSINESLKPFNLIKSTISEVASSPYLIGNVLGAVVGLASGYVSKKIVTGGSANILRKLFGSVLQFGVTNVVAHRTESIKSFGQNIFRYFRRKKETNTNNY